MDNDTDTEGDSRCDVVGLPLASSGRFIERELDMFSTCIRVYPIGKCGGTNGREKYSVNASSGLDAEERADESRRMTTPRIRTDPSMSSKGRGDPAASVCRGAVDCAMGTLCDVHRFAMSIMARNCLAQNAKATVPIVRSTRSLS